MHALLYDFLVQVVLNVVTVHFNFVHTAVDVGGQLHGPDTSLLKENILALCVCVCVCLCVCVFVCAYLSSNHYKICKAYTVTNKQNEVTEKGDTGHITTERYCKIYKILLT